MAIAIITSPPIGPAARAAARRMFRRVAGDASVFASAFLPRAKRTAVHALGSFCAMIGEAVGDAGAAQEPNASASGSSCCSGDSDGRLAMLRERLDTICDGRLELPNPEFRDESQHILSIVSDTVQRYEIPKQHFLDLADGHRADALTRRYPTWRRLEEHCTRTAGSIAQIFGAALGVRHSDAGRHATALACAVRLTNLLHDVKADLARGKIYLPLEDLARFRYSERDLEAGTINDAWRELMRFEIARARDLYRVAADGICWLADDGSRLAVATLAVVSAGALDAIERHGYDVFSNSRRTPMTTGQKLRRLPSAWRLAKREAIEPLPNVFE